MGTLERGGEVYGCERGGGVRGVRWEGGGRFTSGVGRWLRGGSYDWKKPLALHWKLSQREYLTFFPLPSNIGFLGY